MVDRAEQYATQWLQLSPRGRAWSRGLASLWRKLGVAFGAEFSRIHAHAENLLAEANPATTSELLVDWEGFAGLPDDCNPLTLTLRERKQALKSRLTDIGGASPERYTRLAASLGYEITIEKFRPFEFGRSAFGGGQECGGAEIRARLRVHVPGPRVTRFEFGVSHFGEPMARIARAEDLECRMGRVIHSHQQLQFAYQGV